MQDLNTNRVNVNAQGFKVNFENAEIHLGTLKR